MSLSKSIITSPNDHRQYRYLKLDNNLRVLVVEDMQASQAAASMAVNVGHFDDPKQREGMAHFLEHMLFLGTEKYPKAGEYNAFINQHGGSNNAWTGTEHTNFFYSIAPGVFEESLDRFSQFFISPLFNPELVDRERQAIESEYSLKLKDDIRRVYQVTKETVNQDHPFAKFSVGNLETLGGDQQQLRDELLTFYQEHYSANLMTLCLIGPFSLDVLSTLAKQYFTAITDNHLVKHHNQVPLFTEKELVNKIHITPIKEQKRLSINFSLPAIDTFYQRKPLTFISHLLGNESQGSLLSYLKNKGLANSLSAGGGVNGYNFKDYAISFQLTDKGLHNIDSIIQATFEYIELIKQQGLEEWRYQERSSLLKLAFRYQEQIKPLDLASHLSINMHHYQIEDLVFGDYRMDGLNKTETLELLDLMSPDNCRVQVVAQELETNKQAQWYHTPYQVVDMRSELEKYKVTEIRDDFFLPSPNPFIIDDAAARFEKQTTATPQIIFEQEGIRLWHKKDDKFNVPKGHLYLSLDSEQACRTPKHAAMTKLYIELLSDSLNEHTYQAEVAGLNYHIYSHQSGLTLQLSGYTSKQEVLLNLLIKKARERNFTEKRFNQIKRQVIRSWQNVSQAKPISQLFTSLTATLQKHSYEPKRMADLLEEVELDELYEHIEHFYEQVFLEGLIYGDWLKSEAERLGKHLNTMLNQVSQPCDESARQLIDLSGSKTLFREITTQHQDSAIIVYYQSRLPTAKKMALFSLLNHAMSSTFFNELRTQRQLGYMVGTGYLPLHKHPGMIFYVQSPTAGPLQLLEAIDEFIADFNYAVLQITNEQWEVTKQGLINQILEKDTNMKTSSQRYWVAIGNKDYSFNQREQVAAHVSELTRADLLKFMMDKMRSKNSDRLVLFSTGDQHKSHDRLNTANLLTDLRTFKLDAEKFSL